MNTPIHNLIIVGSGPSGYTAGLYAARANLSPFLFEGFNFGGLLQTTTLVENYPGLGKGIMGPALVDEFRSSAKLAGARLISQDVEEIILDTYPFKVSSQGENYYAKSIILATGSNPNKLGAPGEDRLSGYGVSYCATCDGALFKDKSVAVIGGGDSAIEEAIFLSSLVKEVKIIHRRAEFRATPVLLDRARSQNNIYFKQDEVVSFEGENTLSHILLKSGERIEASGAFIAIGMSPNSSLFDTQLEVDQNNYLITEGKSSRTSRFGVFGAGDLIDPTYRQAITAAGSGAIAALDAQRYLLGLEV